MTALIFFCVFFFAVKYRRKSPDDPLPKAIHGSIPLEIAWSVIPFLVMMVMFAWGTKLYFQNYTPPLHDTFDIYVTGKQWMWKVQYPDRPARDQRTACAHGPARQTDSGE